MEYLGLPLVLRDGYLSRADLAQSIRYSVGLILSSRVGAFPFRPDYGCDLWEREYSDRVSANRGDIRASLRNAIDKNESRLYNVSVSFVFANEGQPHGLGMLVKVTGNFQDDDGEERRFEASYSLE